MTGREDLCPPADPQATHPSWRAISWPSGIVPVALGPGLVPPVLPAASAGTAALFVAPARSAVSPDAVQAILLALERRPDVGLFYADDAITATDGSLLHVHCKPAFNQALMLSDDYMGFPLLVRSDMLARLAIDAGWWDDDAGWYRLCLATLTAGFSVDRIPETLIATQTPAPRASINARRPAVERWLAEAGAPATVGTGLTPSTFELCRRFTTYPEVTLVVPTRQTAPGRTDGNVGRPHIVDLLNSIAASTYPQDRIRVLIGDDNREDAPYRDRADRFAVQRIVTERDPGARFNYASKMNLLWRAVDTDLMILLNDDVVPRSPGWIEALLTYAMEHGVGGVGARLLFPNGEIQHAGMVGGLHGVFGHPWYRQQSDAPTYDDWGSTQRDCSAVTGAVFATRRSVMEAVNGFDEAFSLDFNDVDICLRMRMLGYRIVYTPFAEFTHFEMASRKRQATPGPAVARFLRRWHDVLADDPSYSPQLRTDREDIAPLDGAARWIGALAPP